jgi:hypothetical protein
LDAQVRHIVDELLTMFRFEWEQHSHVHENYFSSPDEDIHPFEARSDFLLSWGNLLAYLAMQQLADARPGGWRFGHPGRPAELTNLTLHEGRLSVTAAERLRVTLDDTVLVDAPAAAVVQDYRRTDDTVSAVVSRAGHDISQVNIGVPAASGPTVTVRVGDAPPTTVPVQRDRTVPVALVDTAGPVPFVITAS